MVISSKISLESLALSIRSEFLAKHTDCKIVFVSGNFKVLHTGHLRLLRFAKELGDKLIVGVHATSNDLLQEHEQIRLKLIQSLEWVDAAIPLNEPIESVIYKLRPAFVVKGKEHEFKDNPEQAILQKTGGKLIFSSGETSFSTFELEQENIRHLNTLHKPQDYIDRHAISMSQLRSILNKFKALKACVIGDTIVDEYIHCEPLGMSQEDPTIVVTPIGQERFIGGAAIVAAHVKSLGAQDVALFSVLGQDEPEHFARTLCHQCKINTQFIIDESRPTTLKQKYRSKQKTLLRVNHLRQHDIDKDLQKNIYNQLVPILKQSNILIFSDFSYGALPQPLVNKITTFCKNHNIFIFADSQCSSQIGDITRFKGTTFISPTEFEARVSLKNNNDGLVVLAEKLRKKTLAKHIFITLGENGLLINATNENNNEFETDNLPAFNIAAKDNAGAGDCFLAVSAMAIATGASIWESAFLGSLAAACQVSRLGNTPLSITNILTALQQFDTL